MTMGHLEDLVQKRYYIFRLNGTLQLHLIFPFDQNTLHSVPLHLEFPILLGSTTDLPESCGICHTQTHCPAITLIIDVLGELWIQPALVSIPN